MTQMKMVRTDLSDTYEVHGGDKGGVELYNDDWPTSCATYTGISKSYEAIFLE